MLPRKLVQKTQRRTAWRTCPRASISRRCSAPVEGDAPEGTDLREDFSAQSPYFRLRDARAEARDAEKAIERGEPNAPEPLPFWRNVRELAAASLARSKDLEVAAWMTEAMLRLSGLRGLASGARLIAGLAERYWEGLFPMPDDDGMETRLSAVTGLNGRGGPGSLIQPLYRLPLFPGADGRAVNLFQFQQSEQLPALDAARRQQRIERGTVPLEELERAARAAGASAFGPLLNEAQDALGAWEEMTQALDSRAGADGPSTSQVREILQQIVAVAARYAPEGAGAPSGTAVTGGAADRADEAEPGTHAQSGGIGAVVITGRIATREDAFRTLSEVALFFRRTEPHSPLGYMLDETIRRGRLPWPELLAEIVQEEGTRHAILTSLGIRPPPPAPEE